jgi:hypothetical protein
MGTFSEISEMKQWGALVLGGLILTAALYFTLFKSQRDQNLQAQQQLETKLHENAELEAYRPKLAEMERQLASLKQHLEIERRGGRGEQGRSRSSTIHSSGGEQQRLLQRIAL